MKATFLLWAVLLLPWGIPCAVPQEKAADARSLIQKLSSEQASEREDAYSRLKALGKAARPELERSLQASPDAELQVRLRRLLRIQELTEAVPPSLLKALPNLDEQLASSGDVGWVEAFLDHDVEDGSGWKTPGLTRADREYLAERALLAGLNSDELRRILRAIEDHFYRRPLPTVRGLLARPELDLRMSAVRILSRHGDPSGLPVMFRLSSSKVPGVAPTCIRGIQDVAVRSPKSLLDLLRHDDPIVRAGAARYLGTIPALEGSNEALKASLGDADPAVVSAAIESLAFLKAADLAGTVRPFLDHRDPEVRAAAAGALGVGDGDSSVPNLVPLLEDPSELVRGKVLAVLCSLTAAPAAPAAEKLLADRSAAVRANALCLLMRTKSVRHPEEIARMLQDPTPDVRARAVAALGSLGNPEDAPLAAGLLNDSAGEVRREAARALPLTKGDRFAPKVVEILWSGSYEDRRELHRALAQFPPSAVVPLLMAKLVAGGDSDGAELAADALAEMDRTTVLSALSAGLAGEDKAARRCCVWALGELRFLEAKDRVLPLLRSPDPELAGEAAEALGKLRGAEGIPDLRKLVTSAGAGTRAQAITALGSLAAGDAIPEIEAALADSVEFVRGSAVRALAELNGRQALPKVRKLASDPEPRVRAHAIESIGRLGSSEDVPFLQSLLADQDLTTRISALRALGMLGDRKAVPAVEVLLDDVPAVRVAAAECLCRLGSSHGAFVVLDEGGNLFRLHELAAPEELREFSKGDPELLQARSLRDFIERAARRAGMEASFDRDPGLGRSWRDVRRSLREQGPSQALRSGFRLELDPECQLLLAGRRVRVVRTLDAVGYWSGWIRSATNPR